MGGGPLVVVTPDPDNPSTKTIHTQVGVTSYGDECGKKTPGVYARVSSGKKFIFGTMMKYRTPTRVPTRAPTRSPTRSPTRTPTPFPTEKPSKQPTKSPTNIPTNVATPIPTQVPTPSPSASPSAAPSVTLITISTNLKLNCKDDKFYSFQNKNKNKKYCKKKIKANKKNKNKRNRLCRKLDKKNDNKPVKDFCPRYCKKQCRNLNK